MEMTKNLHMGTYDVIMLGKFTFGDHIAFREVLEHIADPSVHQVVLHMGQVNFVDSAALGMLLLALDESEMYQKQLIISGATGQVKKMFDMARFHTLFTLMGAA